ncbi:MAG TPA: hypothetical protein PKO18_03290 [Chitinophagales bacterium]|nr:hypothetical protein [Chitinophagales bacterium]
MKFIYCIILILLLIISCKKEDSNKSVENNLIKTKTTSTSTEHYFYDAQNRILRIDFYTNHSDTVSYYYTYLYTDSAIYEYHSNEPVTRFFNPDSITQFTCFPNPYKLSLKNNRYMTNVNNDIFNIGHYICDGLDEGTDYDANGFKNTYYSWGVDWNIRDTFYNDGLNYLYLSGSFGGLIGYGRFMNTYYYLPDKKNTIGNSNFGRNYLGKSSYCLIYQETVNTENLFNSTEYVDTIFYNYDWDHTNRVVTTYKKYSFNLAEDTTYYSYY